MADWIGIDSSHIHSVCGSQGAPYTLANALNGIYRWVHLINHTHWFIIDLGETKYVTKVRGRSDYGNYDPTNINIYVSDDTGDWGAAVASGINTWQDTTAWVEIDTTPKNGRYVKVEITDTEEVNNYVAFGDDPPFTIFDVYGEPGHYIWELSGTVSVQSALTGNLVWVQDLAGSISSQSSASALLNITKSLAGNISAETALTGNLNSILVYTLSGSLAGQSGVDGYIKVIESLAGLVGAQSTVVGKLRDLSSLSGTVDAQVTVAGNLIELKLLAGTISVYSKLTGNLIRCYVSIPPFMHKDLIDPYGDMGAWLWLAEIVVPTQATQRIACNTAPVVYGVTLFAAGNLVPGRIPLAGDGSIPRIQLRVAQDGTGTLEGIVNATKGGENGTVKLIRTCEKYFDSPIKALERTYDILTAGSDSQWVSFILGIPNVLTQRIPLWSYSSKVCPLATPSLFKGPRCQYAGEDAVCTGLFEDCYTKGNAVHWGAEIGLDPSAVRV